MVMFMSFKLEVAQQSYSNSEREALAVMRALAEVRWRMVASPWPVIVYTDHLGLTTLLVGPDNDAHGRIVKWHVVVNTRLKINGISRHRVFGV
jgi:hypothetical protein